MDMAVTDTQLTDWREHALTLENEVKKSLSGRIAPSA